MRAPVHGVFMLGLATIIVGNGLFKPNVSSLAGPLYVPDDARRNRGFTLFYMGINAGALIAPVLTSVLASRVFGTPGHESYPVVFAASGMGMLIGLVWFWFGRRKFGLGLIGNALGFAVLMYALSSLVGSSGLIPLWPLVLCYVLQATGELCLSPIGLSMVTKLAPTRLVGLGVGGWFLSVAIGENLAGLFVASVSGDAGMTVASALSGYTLGFSILLGGGVLLFLVAPLIDRLMHGMR